MAIKTLAASITKQSTCRSGGGHHRTYVYEPGNGTRYVVRVSLLSPSECAILNAAADSSLVSIGKGGSFVSYPMSHGGGYLSYGYIREKFELGIVDTKALAPLLSHVLGCKTGP